MKVEKKLESFKQSALREVELKRRQSVSEGEAGLKAAVAEAVRGAKRASRERVRIERYEIAKQRNMRVTAASVEAKRALIALRNELIEALFNDVRGDIESFISSDEYKNHLIEEIKKACTSGGYGTVLLTERDMRFAAVIEGAAGLRVERSDENFIGGFKLVSANGRAVLDCTFETRIAERYENFSTLQLGGA